MKRKQLNEFAKSVSGRILEICPDATDCQVYYQNGGVWHEHSGNIEGDDAKISDLGAFEAANVASLRAPGSLACFFRVKDFDASMRLVCPRRLNKRTQQSIHGHVAKIAENVRHRFLATHDPLTECLNQRAFENALRTRLTARPEAGSSVTSGDAAVDEDVYLIAMDLDHFKNVNDLNGHDFGNLVLRAFAWRIEDICEDFETSSGGRLHVDFARPGGEEFHVIVSGQCKADEALSLAKTICAAVRAKPLPTQEEFNVLEHGDQDFAGVLPDEVNRLITVSVGVTGSPQVADKDASSRASLLKRQADLALYSAKVAGRNQVRYFPDILRSFGRILEVHPDTGVVAIDIGSEVGVANGQEFHVIPADFKGDVPFFSGEGRSRKKLGIYPRLRIGRIVAFQVQREVAFCRIAELDQNVERFMPNSLLEEIPLGSIAHLLKNSGIGGAELADVKVIQTYISAPRSQPPICATLAVKIHDFEKLGRDRGSNFVNGLLAVIHKVLTETLGVRTKVGQLELGTIVCAFRVKKIVDAQQQIADLTEKLVNELSEDVATTTGVAFSGRIPKTEKVTPVEGDNALELAVAAAAAALYGKRVLEYFGPGSAREILSAARKDRAYERGMVDYNRFLELGVSGPEIENQMGLIQLEQPNRDVDSAETHFVRALDGEQAPIYRANLALCQFLKKQYAEVVMSSLMADAGNENGRFPQRYIGVVVVALSHSFEALRATLDPDVVRLILDRAQRKEDSGWLLCSDATVELARVLVEEKFSTPPPAVEQG